MHARVDPSIFAIDGEAKQVTPVAELVQVEESKVPDVDTTAIKKTLANYSDAEQPEMGSSILYGALNDLDMGEARIPGFTPPGMPDKGQNN